MQEFSRSNDMAPRPPSSPVTHRKTEKRDNLLSEEKGKGVGEEPNNVNARKPGPL